MLLFHDHPSQEQRSERLKLSPEFLFAPGTCFTLCLLLEVHFVLQSEQPLGKCGPETCVWWGALCGIPGTRDAICLSLAVGWIH